MKRLNKLVCSLVVLSFVLISCNSIQGSSQSGRLDVGDGVDIWNSIRYEIISDEQTIRTIAPELTEKSYMLNYCIKIENRGKGSAESFRVYIDEPVPVQFTHATKSQGIDNGKLNRNDEYELFGYYTFLTRDQLEEFLRYSYFKLEWEEGQTNKELILQFPSKPTN